MTGVLALSFVLGCSGIEQEGAGSQEISVGSAALALEQAEQPRHHTDHDRRQRGPDHDRRQRGSFFTGKYRNLFRELGYSQAEAHAKIEAVYQQLFHGDPETEAVYYEVGANEDGPLAQIRDIANGDIRSEGMSYGMMIAVQLDRQAEFDALWNWARTYMRNADPAHPAYRYFAWSLAFDGTPNDTNPAPDGEEYFATALYFAAGRWGCSGAFDYRAQADEIVDALKNRGDIAGGSTLFNLEQKQVRFSPSIGYIEGNGDHTDPSYHLPAFYELWARWGQRKDRDFWLDAAAVSRDFFVAATHPDTGLAPDYANFDGTPRAASWDANTVNFRFDAWRTAMNWSFDWAWFQRDARERVLSDRLQAFFESQGLASYVANYTLAGEPLVTYRSTGLIAMNAVASLAATEPRRHDFVQALWDLSAPAGQYRYYDGLLYLMALLHVGGEFKVYPPG
jgi:oligosaccharide reducing-end xylanase